jgi:ceramide glucosyltransferase
MIWLLAAACLVAVGYQLTAILASFRQLARREPPAQRLPPVSILKPIRGLDPGFREAIRSHARQDYPEYEILFGVSDPTDPAIAEIEQLRRDFPSLTIRLLLTPNTAPNGKVGTLKQLAAAARHEILLVNDSDIRVPDDYLRRVVAPLEDPQTGVVTCLYRATSHRLPGIWEALGIATDFAPSTLVAPLVGVREFGLGSTLVFRRRELDAIGGFTVLEDYIADDYQLARRITALGLRVHLSTLVVETSLQGDSWAGVWAHQLRWHRTIRVSRGAYIGLPVTHASFWAGLALLNGQGVWCAALLAARLAMALVAGWGVLRSPLVLRYFPLIPLRDLWGTAVWAAGLFGSSVRWRDRELALSEDGRILRPPPKA